MARERVVTRTIEDCVVEVKALKSIGKDDAIVVDTLHLGGQIPEEKALKVAQKMYNTEDYTVVKVLKYYKELTIYGMKEVDFIKLAKPMDDERHFIDGTEVEEDDEE